MVNNSPANTGDVRDIRDASLIPESGRSPEGGHGNPPQYSCLENSMDRGVWQATVHRITRVGYDLATKSPPPHRDRQRSV